MSAEDSSLTENILRRDRRVVVAGLIAITLLAWCYLIVGAGTGMSALEMASATLFPHRMAEAPMAGMSMDPGAWPPGYWIILLTMWWVMMIAMMTPSASPMILLYARASRHAQAKGQFAQGVVPTTTFAGGYLLAWFCFALIATTMQWALERSGLVSAMMMSSMSAGLSAAVLIAAGLYQLSPLKHMCLRHCRAPAEFLSRRWRPGASGALWMGLEHGLYCVGCCWMLMALLFVGGVMNVVWIAVLAVFVLLEKVGPYGPWLPRVTGIILIVWGAAILLAELWTSASLAASQPA